ncbi:hypothetical protein KGF56_004094 [Candida oxycetoniae]|uniref:GP-PDE domain-containing protein n=1 Tax=Candida oxycetoniae TaxID=497107 RepID=A0AAI9SUP5_9ASCO|nr:uncharacterized protein KGF56_004094 [Candida oxycetoniae]KAI3403034.2 hypothetical protein KGF56_004094 [Candida oxycetoniae]
MTVASLKAPSKLLWSSSSSPVIAGHRGFKSRFVENSLVGFTKCYDSGATVIETDLWLSSDNVIVISHDRMTKRVFVDEEGNETNYNISKTPYDPVLKNLKTKQGGYPLLSFVDLLNWFVAYVERKEGGGEGGEGGEDKLKLQLDIKRFNPTKITKYIIGDLLKVKDDLCWWYSRVQFGIWDLKFLKYLNQDEFFQQDIFGKVDPSGYTQFDIFNISVNWRDSINYINYNYYLDETTSKERKKLKLTGVSLLYISTWSIDFLTKFVPLLQIQRLKFYSWTVNNKFQFQYLNKIGEKAKLVEYGIVTDHPDTMVEYKQEILQNNIEVYSSESNDSELSTEIKPLIDYESNQYYNEDGELVIELTVKQMIMCWIYNQIISLNGSNRKIKTESQRFAARVDENKIDEVKINPIFAWCFQTCQKYGIF